jgi:hypothetical protein
LKQLLVNRNITVLEHPPYSSGLTACNFCLFPKIKPVLKVTHFVSVENVKAKAVEILNSLTEHDLWNCFEHWQHRMQLCVNSGTILKAIVVDFPNLLNRKSYRHSLVFFFFFGVRPHIIKVINIICKFCVKDNLSRVSFQVKNHWRCQRVLSFQDSFHCSKEH